MAWPRKPPPGTQCQFETRVRDAMGTRRLSFCQDQAEEAVKGHQGQVLYYCPKHVEKGWEAGLLFRNPRLFPSEP